MTAKQVTEHRANSKKHTGVWDDTHLTERKTPTVITPKGKQKPVVKKPVAKHLTPAQVKQHQARNAAMKKKNEALSLKLDKARADYEIEKKKPLKYTKKVK